MRKKPVLVTKSTLPPMEEYVEMLKPVWDSAWLTNMGENHRKLEEELTGFLDVKELVLFANGHLGLEMLIQGMELCGEVITTPFSFVSTTHAIVRNNLKPVFCDIRESDYTMDPAKIESLITDKTTAILPVHVYGNLCDVEEIDRIARKHNLKVIYDAAHTFGETYKGIGVGNFGDASMFSFHATKVYNTIEGGAVTTSNRTLRRHLDYLKNFGIADQETTLYVGGNAKMNEFQAVMGLCNLRHVEENREKREALTRYYKEKLSIVPGIVMNDYREDIRYNYAYMPVRILEEKSGFTRDDLFAALCKRNIIARKYFYPCINELDCYKRDYDANLTPIARKVSRQVITLPIYPDLEREVIDEIADVMCRLGR